MSLISCYARRVTRLQPPKYLYPPRWSNPALRLALRLALPAARRYFNDGGLTLAIEEEVADANKLGGKVHHGAWDEYKSSFNVERPNFEFKRCIDSSQIGTTVTAVGFLGKPKNMGASMTFANLEGGSEQHRIQLLARAEFNDDARQALRGVKPHSAVSVTGTLHAKYEAKDRNNFGTPIEGTELISQLEIRLESIKVLNTFTRHLHPGSILDPKERNLQIRFDRILRQRLKFRSDVAAFARRELADFQEIETPILFKSTPEGAREFLVPTRNRGFAYGLPQSPQQYKQILMASGINRYVQFAKCFRDEDHRADRQPEFTQIDLEMAWADGEAVMQRVEGFVKALWRWGIFTELGGPIKSPLPDEPFIRMTYDQAMSKHGSDKPDLRIPGEIKRIDQIVSTNLRGMLTSIEDPIVEAFKIRLDGDYKIVSKFVSEFMDSADAEPFKQNVDGAPGVFLFDARRPLNGLHAFGFEGAESLKALYTEKDEIDEGDLLFVQARPDLPHSGGSTMLGKLRLAIHKAALAKTLVEPDLRHHFLWVTDFPMFTLDNSTDPGQGGSSGFSATHHPFTAPKTAADLDLLLTDPLKAKADHYDLVLNGVELGGGSRRIHSAAVQKFIMKDILKMPASRIETFSHLFKALEAGCPPHAGLAIGFDRLIAVMLGRDSVRDVIAFPKNSNGEDPMVQSPGLINQRQLEDYHLKVVGKNQPIQHSGHLVNVTDGKTATLPPNGKIKTIVTKEAVIIDDTSDLANLDVMKSSIIALFKNDKWLNIAEFPNAKIEEMLIALGLEKATPEEVKRNATMWGLPVEKLEELVRAHQTALVDAIAGKPETMQAVMVNDPSDLVRPDDIESYIASVFQNDQFVTLADSNAAIGEAILIALRLEKATPAEVLRSATIYGLPVEKLEELAKLHQASIAEKMASATSKTDSTEKLSELGNLSDPSDKPRS